MPTSEARVLANRLNAQHSTGPRTAEGKASSRRNALKHGLTGEGVALPSEDSEEVERRFQALESEWQPTNESARTLVRRLAVNSVRMDRCVSHETAALTERVRRATSDYRSSGALKPEEVVQRRAEAGALALFDSSKEATLARRYEAAAERGFYRAMKELRQLEKTARKDDSLEQIQQYRKSLGSFVPLKEMASIIDSLPTETPRQTPASPVKSTLTMPLAPLDDTFEVPFAIGRPR